MYNINYMFTCIFMSVYIHIYAYIHIYLYIYIHIYIYIYKHMYLRAIRLPPEEGEMGRKVLLPSCSVSVSSIVESLPTDIGRIAIPEVNLLE
jgi:hypothetical protein